jgi:Ni/Co efflux regulator RcnB
MENKEKKMIKTVVTSLIALAVVATPVAAEARNRDGNGWEHSRGDRQHKRSRISTGEAIAIGVGAFILGAATSSNRRTDNRTIDREVYDREYDYHYRRQQERTCYNEYQPLYDSYGRIVQYAKVTTCY